MPSPMMITDIAAVSIDTTRGSDPSAWTFVFKTTDDAVTFGSIADNGNSFSDGSTSTSKALKIEIAGDAETVAIQDMDSLTVDGVTIWLPALTEDDTLYVDEDGNTWYDEALTDPAGGVDSFSESITMADSEFEGTAFLSDSVTISDATTEEYGDDLSDEIITEDSITESVEDFVIYLDDRVYVSDAFSLSEAQTIDESYGDFTEDSQINTTWTEI